MRGYAAIGLERPKCEANMGGVLRAAQVYGASSIFYTGRKYRNTRTDTMKAIRHLPLVLAGELRDVIPHGAVPVAVDLLEDAQSIVDYVHPQAAFYIFGPEDGTLGRAITDWCRDKIYVPTFRCMNLAATVNVVLYDRIAKQQRGRR
jgi:tRNA(Leu) C34 or U34 (ribose-2'-O)-methylase TrmL